MSQNAFLGVALCAVLIVTALQASPSPNPDVSTKFAELSDQFMKESLALSPTNASAAGYHKHLDPKTGKTVELDAVLDDLSLQGIGKQRAFYEQWRQRFHTETPVSTLNLQDAADWQLIDDQIGLNLLEKVQADLIVNELPVGGILQIQC